MARYEFYPQSVPQRAFFFSSLREKTNPEAQRILAIGESRINMSLQQNFDEQDFLQETYAAIDFLKQAAEMTLANEHKIFEEKIIPACKGTKYEQLARECFQDKQVDYPKLLSLINLLNDDTNEAIILTNDLYNSMKNFNEIANEIIANQPYTEIKTQYNNITTQVKDNAKQNQKKIVSEKAKIFAAQLDIYKNITKDKKNDNISFLKDFLFAHFYDLFTKSTKQYKNPRQKDIYMTELISAATEFIAAHKLLNNDDNPDYYITSLITPFLEEIETDNKLQEQFLEFLRKKSQDLDKHSELLQQKAKQLTNILKRNEEKTIKGTDFDNYISGLTLDVRRKLAQLYPELAGENNKYIQGYVVHYDENHHPIKQLDFNMNRKADRNEYFKVLRKFFKDKKESEIIDEINIQMQTLNKRTEVITIASEWDAAKIIQAIFGAQTNLTGKQNLRNDSTSYTLGTITLETDEAKNEKIIQTLSNLLRDAASQDAQYGTTYQLNIKQKTGKKSKAYRLDSSIKTQQIAEQRFLQQIKDKLEDRQKNKINPQDIFQIDNSVKFHETYNEKTGFSGGSLGNNIETQINNITEMLNLGGINLIDADFLINAVLNAGDALIGASQRSALENYFSTVASMLMFRSGGQQLASLSQQGLKAIHNDTTKIHLYTFNTKFFPESFILQKTYEGLMACSNLLTMSASNYGSRATIYNPISEADIVYKENKPATTVKGKNYSAIKVPDWSETANNSKRVSIDMVLMGGFLDIMKQMLEIMNSY